ncbi:MAG: recombination protein RecR [Nocardiopsis sp. BM-2018]|nr:MAG: recombination protein RecR [Nocardiopsis sp. BM-2018]
MRYPTPLLTLIRALSRLPGIGPKSAQRLAFHLFNQPTEDVLALARALQEAKTGLARCPRCAHVMAVDEAACAVCSDAGRDAGVLCVVEQPADVLAIERSGEYAGRYHVLHGALSPMHGVGPSELTIDLLLERLTGVQEVVLATSTTVEGEATALYLAQQLRPLGVRVTRIAYGLPVGGDLEYADEVTLGRAMTHRRDL